MAPPLSPPDVNGNSNVRAEPHKILDAVDSTPPTKAALTAQWSVQSVLKTLPHPPPPPSQSPLPFLHLIERLKTTKREGWRRFGITSGESIADHMYRMSILTMLAPPSLSSRLNIPHCTKMALVHDMAEALVGDITPADPVTKSEKSRREAEAMSFLSDGGLLKGYYGGEQGKGLREVWEEYEDGKTLESVFVHDVDKMELLLQMVEYERRGEGKLDLGEFVWVTKKIQLEEIKEWCREVLREREEFWEKIGRKPGMLDEGREV